jgi:transcriptional regulator with XRE-family HTH domain
MIDVKELVKLNSEGYTQKEMAKKLNVCRTTVQRALKKLHLSTPNYHNALKFDNTVFDCIDSEEKAYWLGFLYADGNVSSTINNVELSLSAADADHLEKYRKFLKNESPIKISNVTCNGKNYLRCRLSVSNKHFKKQLISLGCTPNKSLNLIFPKGIFKEDDLKYHFIRGYVDGDGCISFTSSGRLNLQIIGTKEFLHAIKEVFPEFSKLMQDKRWKNNTYCMSCNCNNADKVITKLYKNSNIYLQRKYDRIAVLSSNW